jgi:hypothetical protein
MYVNLQRFSLNHRNNNKINALLFEMIRVARWFIFKPKIPIWVNFGGP